MGIYDRDYYRTPPRSSMFNSMRVWSVNTWLIAINVAVFVIDIVSNHLLFEYGAFTINTAVFGLQVWRFITLQFLHANLQHIAFNMIALFFFGPIVEQVLGARRYLAFYLLSGVSSGVIYVLLWMLHLLDTSAGTPLVGASGSIFGVLIAAAMIAPDVTVMIDFFIPMKLRTMAWLLIAVAVFTILTNGYNAGGQAAHIGGAAGGYILIKNPALLNWVNYRRGPRMRYRP
jgi:membrane associated rhomboid family serine protease